MTYRQRLTFFLIAALISIQVLTAVTGYSVVRRNLVQQGEIELGAAATVFTRQLDLLSENVSHDITLLALDYGLRKAVGERDEQTLLSTLRNHGQRVGAERMMVVDLEGVITADTSRTGASDSRFPFSDLIAQAASSEQASALVALDGGIFWTVVAPVKAPVPIAFVIAFVPIDPSLLNRLAELSVTPYTLALAVRGLQGGWSVITQSNGGITKMPAIDVLPNSGDVAVVDDGESLMMAKMLETAESSQPVVAILNYPIDELLSVYGAVFTPMLIVLALSLIVATIGAMLIARGVSRPLEALAASARRIAAGDYQSPMAATRGDEIGQLADALGNMTKSIAERETALIQAVESVEQARNEAVSASEAKSQFLSNMSHELRTPLNAIIGFSEMIHTQVFGPVGVPRYAEYAGNVLESGHQLLARVNEMLDLAESSTGKMALARERVAPGALLRTVLETLSPVAARADVRVTTTGDLQSWPMIEGDAVKLQQGLKNLLHNAIKFTPNGGTVSISGAVENNSLVIRISDTGIGITPEDIPLIVLPFHRRKKAFDGRHQGAGTGLPFAKTILELHGGDLEIESKPGEGTTITVFLPLAAIGEPKSVGHAA